jgi:hypothetical protein
MVGAINAPSTGTTLEAFITLVQNSTASTSPPGGAIGGVLKVNLNSTSTSASGSGGAVTYATSNMTALFTIGAVLFFYSVISG